MTTNKTGVNQTCSRPRHRNELPKFKGKTVAGWKRFSKRLMQEEGVIAASFDAERDAALRQFLRGDYRWQATIEAAIQELDIPDEEVDALRERTRKRMEEVEALLAAHEDAPSTV